MILGMESFEGELSSLSEMFPACDVNTLRGYLEMFGSDPNHMTSIINMLLEQGSATCVDQNQEQKSQQGAHGLKRIANAGEDSLQNDGLSEAVLSPSKVLKCELSTKDDNKFSTTVPLKEIKDFTSRNEEVNTSKNSPGPEKKHQSSYKHDFHKPKTSSSSDEDDIVVVKSVINSPKPSFYRTSCSDSANSSLQKGTGICIRYKGGTLHPSMNKPRRSQIVEIDCDDGKSTSISQRKRSHSLSSQSPNRRSLSESKCFTSATEASEEIDDDLPTYGTSPGSRPQKKANPNSVVKFEDASQIREVSSSGNNHNDLSVADTLTDFDILKKVFPDADPECINSLLDKYADQPNRVALVGKELSNKRESQSVKKKAVQSVPWFWQTEEGKLVPFTDSESNVLEKEYVHFETTGMASLKVRLPGSAKNYDVNFVSMTMTCEKRQKTVIIRAPDGRNNNKQISGKILVPQEALSLPPDWQQQIDNVQLISVRTGSAEWDHIQRSLTRSLREAQVTDIQRVQNKWLYRKYAIQRNLIKDKNGPSCINEKELFHGTRHTNPDIIWKGEDGFDMRHSADGMWGRGTYFATEASYCHQGFVYYNPQNKHYQLFLAHVLTGDSIFLPPNRDIRMPPPKRGSDIRYDSINGFTNGCAVYIVYKLDMAYPAYLITYTITN